MSLKSETMDFEKANVEDEASRPLSRLSATPVIAQPVSSRGLWAPNDDHELTVKGGQAWSPQIHLDLELAIKSRHTWSRMMRLWLELTFSDRHTWSHKIIVTSSWSQKSSHTWLR